MSTKNTINAAAMSAAEINKAAAAILKSKGSISAIKAAAPALRAKYGPENWAGIMATAKAMRKDTISAAGDDSRAPFTYSGVLGAMFAEVSRRPGFKALCKYAKKQYKGRDAETARAVIRDYYSAVDNTGAPVLRRFYVSEHKNMIFEAWERRELTKGAALSILESALKGMESAAKAAARTGKDNAAAVRDNVRPVSVIMAVYMAAQDENGDIFKGGKIEDGAGLVGRSVPAKARTLAEINTELHEIKAKAAAMPKASPVDKHAAKTPAPAKAPKAPKAKAPAMDSKAAAAAAVKAA